MSDGYFDHAKGRVVWGRLEPSLESNIAQRDALQAKIQDQVTEAGMLKGTGFIVIDPAEPRFTGEEHTDVDEAKLVGSNAAYQSKAGYVIVYAPVAIMRPKREIAETTPSKLLQQIGSIALPASTATPAADTKQ